MMRDWNMRSRGYWAIAALAVSAVALSLTAGQASAKWGVAAGQASAKCPTKTGRVSLSEWNCWDSEAIRLNASFNDSLAVESVNVYVCDGITKSGAASQEAMFKQEMAGSAIQPASGQAASGVFAAWGQDLKNRAPSYRTASSEIYKGAVDMISALAASEAVFHSLAVLNCNQATNEAKAKNYWFIGYEGHVIPGLKALRKLVH